MVLNKLLGRSTLAWIGWFFMITLVWSLDVFYIQQITTKSVFYEGTKSYYAWAFVRFVFNFCVLGCCIVLLPRILTYLLFFLNVFFSLLVTSYFNAFDQTLPFSKLVTNTSDFFAVATFDYIKLIDLKILAISLVLLCIKCLVYRTYCKQTAPTLIKGALVITLIAVYVFIFSFISAFKHPLKDRFPILQKFTFPYFVAVKVMSTPNAVYVYGYLPAWIGEFVYIDSSEMLERALKAREEKSEALKDEQPFEISDLVMLIQVESLDRSVINYEHNGTPVTPFLNKIKEQSRFFTVKDNAVNFSADTDFLLLTGNKAIEGIVNYYIDGYPYENTTPEIAKKVGYQFKALAGFDGNVFHAEKAFKNMPDLEAHFLYDLQKKYMPEKKLGQELYDHELFNCALKVAREATQPQMQLIITASSHYPFNILPENTDFIIKDPDCTIDWYLNAINYVDKSLEDFVNNLPDGATIIIYGDHPPRPPVQFVEGAGQFVPVIVYQKGRDLSNTQTTPKQLADSGELEFFDFVTIFRRFLDSAQRSASAIIQIP